MNNKAIIVAIALGLMPTATFAGGEDPSPEKAADPVAKKEQVLGTCLEKEAGFVWVPTVDEYERIRYEKPNHFYFGSRIWISRGSDLAKAKPCLAKVGAKD